MKQSKKWTLNLEDWKKWGKNILIFTTPVLFVLFYQLSQGVTPKIALGVAVLALYGVIADLLKKLSTGK